ncbi:MAG: hypothetical protein KJ871_13270 [Alphaproteobacteria bacterium]|nr:hypothetical protein [Alphaproteobacteria bacterium]MBU2085220.1 hypothetical protein [Alphaproteobacteria bacterium]MBU2142150.1 hypothetical protein [Alphaproteobacteria bacterium]MBU2197042.1 hypothetical protein [Alphaproteobacteria bacterium]
MRLILILTAVLALTACKPSSVFGPESEKKDELLGGETTELPISPALSYPTGQWEDGLGNNWDVSVIGANLAATLGTGNLAGVTMTGHISDSQLVYQIAYPESTPLAQGEAHLIDDTHALFETHNPDGSLNAHGLLHFNHAAFVPAGQPTDLRPQTVDPDTDITGD